MSRALKALAIIILLGGCRPMARSQQPAEPPGPLPGRGEDCFYQKKCQPGLYCYTRPDILGLGGTHNTCEPDPNAPAPSAPAPAVTESAPAVTDPAPVSADGGVDAGV